MQDTLPVSQYQRAHTDKADIDTHPSNKQQTLPSDYSILQKHQDHYHRTQTLLV